MINIVQNKNIPQGYAFMIGSVCKHCRRQPHPGTLCSSNLSGVHELDVQVMYVGNTARLEPDPEKPQPQDVEPA